MITKDSVQKALSALEGGLAKSDLGPAEGAAEEEGSLKAPGTKMSAEAPKGEEGKAKKSLAKGEFPPKHKEPDADDEGGESDDDADDEGDEPKKKAKKSMPAAFAKSLPAEVSTKVEISTFLKSLVDHTAQSVDGLRDFVAKSDMANENRYDDVSAQVDAIQKSLGGVGVVLRAICERIGVIESAPAHVAKSQTAAVAPQPVAKSVAVDRTFTPEQGAGAEQAGEGMFKSLVGKPPHIAKAMVSEALCDLVRKGEAKDTDVINFETFQFVPPELQPKLAAALN